MPDQTTLSESALALFRLHVARHGQVDVDESTRGVPRAGAIWARSCGQQLGKRGCSGYFNKIIIEAT